MTSTITGGAAPQAARATVPIHGAAETANGDNTPAVARGDTTVTVRAVEIDPVTKKLGGSMTTARGYSAQKDNYTKRLRRIEGQVRGIAKMIEQDTYCIDVLTQISAVNSAMRSVALGLLDEHLDHCVRHAVAEGGGEAEAKIAEASAAIARLVRS